MLKELSFAVNEDVIQIGRKGDNLKAIPSKRGFVCSRVAGEYDLYTSLGDVDRCGVFDMFKVKVPVIFSCTKGFSPQGDEDGLCDLHVVSPGNLPILIGRANAETQLQASAAGRNRCAQGTGRHRFGIPRPPNAWAPPRRQRQSLHMASPGLSMRSP